MVSGVARRARTPRAAAAASTGSVARHPPAGSSPSPFCPSSTALACPALRGVSPAVAAGGAADPPLSSLGRHMWLSHRGGGAGMGLPAGGRPCASSPAPTSGRERACNQACLTAARGVG
eukprot:1510092-Pleurochrysis_carterae.AAC.1